MRTCTICKRNVPDKEICKHCNDNIPDWPEPDLMTPEERIREFKLITKVLETEFCVIHERIEKLVVRPVWAHELANKNNLIKEIRERKLYDGNVEQAFEKAIQNLPNSIKNKTIIMDGSDVYNLTDDIPDSFKE